MYYPGVLAAASLPKLREADSSYIVSYGSCSGLSDFPRRPKKLHPHRDNVQDGSSPSGPGNDTECNEEKRMYRCECGGR